jgi:hypothetical protein
VVDAEETEVLALAEAGGGEDAFGFGGGGFFEDGVDLVEFGSDGGAADGAEEGEEAFAGGGDGGDGAAFGGVDADELGGEGGDGAVVGEVEVIADEVEEGGVGDEIAGEGDGVRVAAGFGLFDEGDAAAGGGEEGLEAGRLGGGDDDGDFVDGIGEELEEKVADCCAAGVRRGEGLVKEVLLTGAGGGDDGF